ncbi:hypothetical protein [Microbacterium aurum]
MLRPTSLVLVGISRFSGSDPFVVMMAVLLPPPDALGVPLPLPEQPARARLPAASERDAREGDLCALQGVPPVQG